MLLISSIKCLYAATWFSKPSGIRTHPKFFPFLALSTTISLILLTISTKVSLLNAHSSEIMTTLGWVYKAHSRAKWEGSLPINLMKYQYFIAEALSVSIFPTN